jgi:hypothetical protein
LLDAGMPDLNIRDVENRRNREFYYLTKEIIILEHEKLKHSFDFAFFDFEIKK